MDTMQVFVERTTQEAQLSMRCGCGSCHPTATVYRDDPRYEWHEARLAEAPCCCGRFFVVGHDEPTAQARAEAMAQRVREKGRAPSGHIFRPHTITLPWGATVAVVSVDLRDKEGPDPEHSKRLRTR
jgi:hypothetical protein